MLTLLILQLTGQRNGLKSQQQNQFRMFDNGTQMASVARSLRENTQGKYDDVSFNIQLNILTFAL